MMEDYKSEEWINAIHMVNPFQKVIHYFVIGFIVSSFQFDIGCLPILSSLVSILCFYLGLRMIKKENKAFFWAYIFTILLMIISVFQALVLATPIDYPSVFELISLFLKLLQVLLICFGLHKCMPKQKYPLYMFISYMTMNLVILIGENEIPLILFIIGFISLLYWLLESQKYLMNYNYQIKLSHIKVNEKVMWLSYIGISAILVIVLVGSYPFMAYQYSDRIRLQYTAQPLDVMERKNSDSLMKNESSQAIIYDYDDTHYLYVYHFQFYNIQEMTTSLVISVEQTQGNTNQVIEDIYVSDGQTEYVIQDEEEAQHRLPSMFNSFGNANNYYVVDVNPLVNDLDVTIIIKVEKDTKETKSDYHFQFFFQNGFTYPYSTNHGYYIGRGYSSNDGKW